MAIARYSPFLGVKRLNPCYVSTTDPTVESLARRIYHGCKRCKRCKMWSNRDNKYKYNINSQIIPSGK